eukprot:5223385-Alexandrium_andersonii.AAC.1
MAPVPERKAWLRCNHNVGAMGLPGASYTPGGLLPPRPQSPRSSLKGGGQDWRLWCAKGARRMGHAGH